MIANGIGKRPPTALAKKWGDKNQPLPAIGAKAMIKTKPPTQGAFLGQKQIKQCVIMLPELDGGFGWHYLSLNAALELVILAESR